MSKLKLMLNGKCIMTSEGYKITLDAIGIFGQKTLIFEPGDTLTLEVEKEKLTADEKVILRSIDSKYKWIARDEVGRLFCFYNEPLKRGWGWDWDVLSSGHKRFCLFEHLFKSIRWSDDESQEIAKLLED